MTNPFESSFKIKSIVSLILLDVILIILAIYYAHKFSYSAPLKNELLQHAWPLFPILILIGISVNWFLAIPHIKLQLFDLKLSASLALSALSIAITTAIYYLKFIPATPEAITILIGVIFFISALLSRALIIAISERFFNPKDDAIPVAIYGAGEAGMQLASALIRSREVRPVVFIDDNKAKQKTRIFGLPILNPNKLQHLAENNVIKQILFSIPSLSEIRRNKLLQNLTHLDCPVKIVPSHVDVIRERDIFDNLIDIKPNDLLYREKLDHKLLDAKIKYEDKTIFVSGAGGSIGLEICRQLFKFSPKKIILFEQSELALYTADQELAPLAIESNTVIEPIIGSICEPTSLSHVFSREKIDVVFHAAAYKHVPIVEKNKIEGVRTNVLGTYLIAKQAKLAEVETFILISTDKAVRPSNVMGATKRLAEIITQDFDQTSPNTTFSMVRFGNVLGSSGSVIPLFKHQIAHGGPVTITDENVSRYFMAISEAAFLVIISGSFAKGGELFLLDMGEPIKIIDIAKQMIRKSGYSVKDHTHPDGDIEIVTIGLRPGDKITEELLISAPVISTTHPKILQAHEVPLANIQVKQMISKIKTAISSYNEPELSNIIREYLLADNNLYQNEG